MSLFVGDVRDGLRAFIAAGVRAQTCVTSPPYWGLRDYGMAGQIGLEPTFTEYVQTMVEVFRLVRDVLADDGTLWLNLGDSYNDGSSGTGGKNSIQATSAGSFTNVIWREDRTLKQKDLCGIPWRVALALQQPYYAGQIKAELDRIWLAAMVDGEGCFYIHKRLAGQHAGDGYMRQSDTYSPAFEVANTHKGIIDRCMAIAGVGSIIRQDKDRRQPLYRWTVRADEAKAVAREIYPYLVGKQQQCRIVCGMPSNGERADAAWAALKLLHAGSPTDVDFSAPPTLHTPGWYLRSDVIWAKPNPMPESVTDRPTKAHEYLFLLAKSERYFYDADAIAEPVTLSTIERVSQPTIDEQAGSYRQPGKTNGPMRAVVKSGNKERKLGDERGRPDSHLGGSIPWEGSTRNRRTVWTIGTEPYSDAHFAVMPTALVEPCVLAGSRVGDVVLDPFMGSGTVAQVAQSLGRRWIGCELNPKYAAMIERRTAQMGMELTA